MIEPHDPQAREADRLIHAGLLGLAAAGVLQLGERADLNLAQLIGVYAFAAGIPLLAVGLITDYARRAGTPVPSWMDLVGLLGALAAVVGFGAMFFHFGPIVGGVFITGCILGVILVRRL